MLENWIPRRRITGTGMWLWPHPVGSAKDQNLLLAANRLPVQTRFLALFFSSYFFRRKSILSLLAAAAGEKKWPHLPAAATSSCFFFWSTMTTETCPSFIHTACSAADCQLTSFVVVDSNPSCVQIFLYL